jgi:hypothetical protein
MPKLRARKIIKDITWLFIQNYRRHHPSPHLFVPRHRGLRMEHLVLVLDATAALAIDERAPRMARARAPVATEEAAACSRGRGISVAAAAAAQAEEDGGEEIAGDCCPGETVSVAAEVGVLTRGVEMVAAEDRPGAIRSKVSGEERWWVRNILTS